MLELKVDKSRWICQKKLSDAEILHRRGPNTNQTHIGLFESSVPLESAAIPSLLIYENKSFDTLTFMDPIKTPQGYVRSPKARQGNRNDSLVYEDAIYESTYQKISDIISSEDNMSSFKKDFFIIYGSLTNGRLFFILYHINQSNLFKDYQIDNAIFEIRNKGIPETTLHEKFRVVSEKFLENYYLEDSIIQASELIRTNTKTTRYIPESDRNIILEIGRLGEELINSFLDEKKFKKEISDYYWLSNVFPGADHDFEITEKNGQINMLEVKSTQSNFEKPFYSFILSKVRNAKKK